MNAADEKFERELREALTRTLQARRDLHKTIRSAHRKGWSLRRIAEVVNISHEQVRQIVGPTT